jgi:hypothetical protein
VYAETAQILPVVVADSLCHAGHGVLGRAKPAAREALGYGRPVMTRQTPCSTPAASDWATPVLQMEDGRVEVSDTMIDEHGRHRSFLPLRKGTKFRC